MKKMIICISVMLGMSLGIQAQSVVREGMTFKSVTRQSAKTDTLLTSFTFEDSKGMNYPIIVNRSTGKCWIWKKSSKTGKMYKQYMKGEVSREVCRELGISYIPKKEK